MAFCPADAKAVGSDAIEDQGIRRIALDYSIGSRQCVDCNFHPLPPSVIRIERDGPRSITRSHPRIVLIKRSEDSVGTQRLQRCFANRCEPRSHLKSEYTRVIRRCHGIDIFSTTLTSVFDAIPRVPAWTGHRLVSWFRETSRSQHRGLFRSVDRCFTLRVPRALYPRENTNSMPLPGR